MKNSQFWLGLFLGATVSLVVSLGLFYWYVVTEIESIKAETRKEYKDIRTYFDKLMKDELSGLKENAWQLAKEKLNDLQDKIIDKDEEKKSEK